MWSIVRQFLLFAICWPLTVSIAAAAVDLENGQKIYNETCATCHLPTAQGSGAIPQLAGQDSNYLKKQIRDIQNGSRQSAIMAPFVKNLTEISIADINAYLVTLPAKNDATDPKLFARGQLIYHAGLAQQTQSTPACAACHGPAGKGIAGVPVLAGQHAAYIVSQLQAFQTGARSNDPNSMMQTIAKNLSDDDKKAVASYISGMRSS